VEASGVEFPARITSEVDTRRDEICIYGTFWRWTLEIDLLVAFLRSRRVLDWEKEENKKISISERVKGLDA